MSSALSCRDGSLPGGQAVEDLEVFAIDDGGPVRDLAFETLLLERAAQGRAAIAFASWPGPVVVLGYSQDANDVDLDWCRDRGVPVLRRLTGGTGVVHAGDLGVALALPVEHPWARGIVALYDHFVDALLPGLTAAGGRLERLVAPRHAARVRSPICFEDQLADTLVTTDGRKAVGCAQSRRAKAVLIHAAVLLGLDAAVLARVFRVDEARVRAHLAPAVPGADPQRVAEAISGSVAGALAMAIVARRRPRVSERLLAPWAEPRWAPVPPSPAVPERPK
jgi:lipoyl(octanoyl) transferase